MTHKSQFSVSSPASCSLLTIFMRHRNITTFNSRSELYSLNSIPGSQSDLNIPFLSTTSPPPPSYPVISLSQKQIVPSSHLLSVLFSLVLEIGFLLRAVSACRSAPFGGKNGEGTLMNSIVWGVITLTL